MPPFWCLIFLGGLLPPSQGFLNLLNPAQPSGGLLGTGLIGGKSGLPGTGALGEGGLLGTGLLGKGSPLGAGNEPSSAGALGTGLLGGQPGSSGLLGTGILGGKGLGPGLLGEGLGTGILSGEGLASGILGGEGLASGILGGEGLASGILGGEGLATGLLGGEGLGNGLLNNGLLGNGLLGNNSLLGQTGLLGTGLLGKGGLLGNGSLLGLDGVLGAAGGLLGGGGPQKMTRYAWLKVLNLENVRVSWKVLRGTELVLNLYSKLVLRFPGIFQFLSGSSVEANITSHIALTQDSPGDLKLVVKNCSNLLGGFSVSLRKGLLTNVVSSLVNKSLKSLVPALLCPIVNLWVSIININLQFLNRVISFGLLGKIYSALSKLPVTSGHYVELDLQNSPFPSTFIDWLLQTAGVNPRINP
ncbi:BPI fold-containing family B member 4-like [Passer montanus]|uniref:BPI fold-containing family B member 4-like n=1 Tax=Passer montanus TaxID=9160 RepID=UPI00195F81CA|nr:BPI fold-containing family B member 4-like [Passer montanus]